MIMANYVKANFKQGKENGLYKRWYKDGKLDKLNFKDGKEDGLCKGGVKMDNYFIKEL